jgi:RNA polymerase sigma-70 factor, ECF subfamily
MSKSALLFIEQMEQSLAPGAADPDPAVEVQMTVAAAASAPAAGRSEEGPGDPAPQPLESLAGAAASGDPRARKRLLGEIHTLVLGYCHARLGRHETAIGFADDIAQEVCLTVIDALPGYTPGQSFRGFVYGVAAHEVTGALRATGRNHRQSVVRLSVPGTHARHGPEQERLLARELAERLGAFLHRLSARQREVLVLRIASGLSAEETALVVGTTPGAVRVTQHRALSRLRQMASASADVHDEPASPAAVPNAPDEVDTGSTGDSYLDDLLERSDRRLRAVVSAGGGESGVKGISTAAPGTVGQDFSSPEDCTGDSYIDGLLCVADAHLRDKIGIGGSRVPDTDDDWRKVRAEHERIRETGGAPSPDAAGSVGGST